MAVLKNPKHETYAQNLASGMSQEAAYEAAGYKPDRGAASRLLSTNVSVASRVRELQEASAATAVVDAASLSLQLEDVRVKAIAANQMGAAAQAIMGRAKLHGLIIDKAEVKDTTLDPDVRRTRIQELSQRLGLH